MKKIISEIIERYNKAEVRNFLDKMKTIGFKYGTKSGLTVAMSDIKTPETKDMLVNKANEEAAKIQNLLEEDIITYIEVKNAKLELWNETTDKIQAELVNALQEDKFNPVDMMVKSGARGNMMQVRQLGGMRGLVANPKGEMIERPIQSNFREGMSVL